MSKARAYTIKSPRLMQAALVVYKAMESAKVNGQLSEITDDTITFIGVENGKPVFLSQEIIDIIEVVGNSKKWLTSDGMTISLKGKKNKRSKKTKEVTEQDKSVDLIQETEGYE